ncbi:hypothetical protein [Rhodobacter sp. JA431]|uniref:hypothetical protein n=1 Tax=Rhodobacter sp. JA431 TaxID=570013 RepID=UPI00116045F7|nr:hypothetical protein [Rhodobacter sp. JA431]
MYTIISLPPRPARISAKVRKAVELMVTEALPIVKAAEGAGMSRQGLSKALRRPEVQDFKAEVEARFVAEMDLLRARAEAVAIKTGLELMRSAKSETVRARLVEFFASGGKSGAGVNVHVDARHVAPQGYIYPEAPSRALATTTDTGN